MAECFCSSIWKWVTILSCYCAILTFCEDIKECFQLPVTTKKDKCKKIDPNGNCLDEDPEIALHYDSRPTQLQIMLPCPPKSKYIIESLVYSIPQQVGDFCNKRCVGANCDCCAGNDSVALCTKAMSEDKLKEIGEQCKNITKASNCEVTVEGIIMDKQVCSQLDYSCDHKDGTTNVCYSRWVDISYSCDVGKNNIKFICNFDNC